MTNPRRTARAGIGPVGRRRARRAATALLVLASAGSVALAPAAVGVGWREVARAVLQIGPPWLLYAALAWAAALCAYALVMTVSLPGLSGRRALGLNLAGSALANSMPLGGAAGLGLTAAMARSWGFGSRAVSAFLTITNVWNLVGRLVFGVLALGWFLLAGPGLATGPAAAVVAAACTVVLLVAAAMAVSVSVTRGLGATATALGAAVGAVRGRSRGPGAAGQVRDHTRSLLSLRRQVLDLGRTSWPRAVVGMAANLVLLAVLLDACLRGLGLTRPLVLSLAAVGVERLATALPITPGGTGAAELTLLACLTAAGVPPVSAVAATLLYRFFTFLVEIPLGAVVVVAWRVGKARRIGAVA